MLKTEVFHIFFKKKLKIIYFIMILVEIWLVESKLEFVTVCHTQIGPFFVQKFSKSCHFWPKMTQNGRLSDVLSNYVLMFPNFHI